MGTKISALTAAAAAAGANELAINEAGTSKKVTVTQILTLAGLSGLTDNTILRANGATASQGTGITIDDNNIVDVASGQIHSTIATLSDGANISWNLSTRQCAQVTLAGNRTLDNPTNLKSGAIYMLKVIQDGTGGRTLTWSSSYKFTDGVDPVLSAGANAVDIFMFFSDGTNMYGTYMVPNAG